MSEEDRIIEERVMSREEFINVLNEMDLPVMRREINESNLRWMMRNIRVCNGDHPRIKEVLGELRRLLLACN